MALVDLIYRCPECGHAPTEGTGDTARCIECGAGFARSPVPGSLRVVERDGTTVDHLAAELVRRVGDRGASSGHPNRARARLRSEVGIVAIRHRGELLGFAERLGPARPGVLAATVESLTFDGDGGDRYSWPVLEIIAVLGSSSALQFTVGGTLHQLEFEADSAFRWEALVERLVREAWRGAGRGEVVEFRPRIDTG